MKIIMNRKRIRIEKLDDFGERCKLATMHGYQVFANGAIKKSPEYRRWQDFFDDLVEDLYLGVEHRVPPDQISVLWVPGSRSIGQASRKYLTAVTDPEGGMEDFLEELQRYAETYGDVLVQYGEFPGDRITLRIDEQGRVYCVKANIFGWNLPSYEHNFNGNGLEHENICAYYHKPRQRLIQPKHEKQPRTVR
jgi:hypothetical protein